MIKLFAGTAIFTIRLTMTKPAHAVTNVKVTKSTQSNTCSIYKAFTISISSLYKILIKYYQDSNDIKYMHENNHQHNLDRYYCKVLLNSNSIIRKKKMLSIYRAKLCNKLSHHTSNYNKNHSLKIIQNSKANLHFLLN